MQILALETTERVGSLALLESTQVVAERQLPADQRTAATFAIAMKGLLAEVDWQPDDLDLVAVCEGPGSFTGLRIGITAAKTLAYATGADVVAVNTLEVIALGSGLDSSRLWTVMDAFRGQVFAALFEVTGFGSAAASVVGDSAKVNLAPLAETQILEVDDWLAQLTTGDTVTGPMLGKLQDRIPAGVDICDPARWTPTAAHLGRWAWRQYQAGQRDDLWQLVPNYFRKSAAEEVFDKKQADKAQGE